MKEDLILFKTAELAKELCFDEPTTYFYNNNGDLLHIFSQIEDIDEVVGDIENLELDKHNSLWKNSRTSAPTQNLLQKWLRETYNVDISIVTIHHINEKSYRCEITYVVNNTIHRLSSKKVDTYKEALDEGLNRALLIVEKHFTNK